MSLYIARLLCGRTSAVLYRLIDIPDMRLTTLPSGRPEAPGYGSRRLSWRRPVRRRASMSLLRLISMKWPETPGHSQFRCLFGPQASCFNHSTPFLGLLGEVHSEFGRRGNKGRGAQLRKSRFQLCVREARIDLFVQLIDNLGARVSWSANTIPGARLIARQEIAHNGDVRQRPRASRPGGRERKQPAGPDVLNRRG